jgi:Rho termination factor, N-terminal domain
MEWHDLEKMTVVKLREEAHEKGIESVHGKNKAELVEALAGVLGIEKPHEELATKQVGTKGELKQQIRELKAKRSSLVEAGDHKGLKDVRRKVHGLKRKIRRIHAAAAKAS